MAGSYLQTVDGVALPDRTCGTGVAVLDGADSRAGYRWHVLHTRSRQEKVIAEVIGAAGATAFLPLQRKVMFYGHRKRVVEVPLFSCYVFLYGLAEHAYQCISAKRVAKILPVDDQDRLRHEITQLQVALARGATLGPTQFLTRGRRVRVARGPFLGVEGVVEDSLKEDRIVLKVHAIGRALSLEIDGSLLEPVD
jgi:transcription antitermination factor NusG